MFVAAAWTHRIHQPQTRNPTHRPLSSSFLGVPYRVLYKSHKKELLRGLRVNSGHVFLTNPDMLHFTILASHARWRHVWRWLRCMYWCILLCRNSWWMASGLNEVQVVTFSCRESIACNTVKLPGFHSSVWAPMSTC